jgi:hypothetical protein
VFEFVFHHVAVEIPRKSVQHAPREAQTTHEVPPAWRQGALAFTRLYQNSALLFNKTLIKPII